jgi:RNA polymerase sigma factor (sigma-70 family)
MPNRASGYQTYCERIPLRVGILYLRSQGNSVRLHWGLLRDLSLPNQPTGSLSKLLGLSPLGNNMSTLSGEKHFLSEQSTTHWGTVFEAQNTDQGIRNAALQRFVERYRLPVELEIRCFSSWAEREVEDLASEFKLSLLEKLPALSISPDKGCFRDWLKKCIKNFLIEKYRQRKASKRGADHEHVSADAAGEDGQPLLNVADGREGQAQAFDRAWAQQVVRLGLVALEQECTAGRKEAFFKEIKPVLIGSADAVSYAMIGQRLGMSEGAVKVAAKRTRERLGELIRAEVRESVGSKADVNDEIKFLMSLL